MNKIPKIILICAIISAITFGYLFYSVAPNNTNVIGSRFIVGLSMAGCGGVAGGIFGLILYVIFRPSRTQRMIRKNTDILLKSNQNSKINDLNNLNNLKQNGAITEEEFEKLKKDIISK